MSMENQQKQSYDKIYVFGTRQYLALYWSDSENKIHSIHEIQLFFD